jgi:hypothetical protein
MKSRLFREKSLFMLVNFYRSTGLGSGLQDGNARDVGEREGARGVEVREG